MSYYVSINSGGTLKDSNLYLMKNIRRLFELICSEFSIRFNYQDVMMVDMVICLPERDSIKKIDQHNLLMKIKENIHYEIIRKNNQIYLKMSLPILDMCITKTNKLYKNKEKEKC